MMTIPRVGPWNAFAWALFATISASPAFALWEAAEGEVFLSLDAAVSADSNIGSNALERSDTTYSVTPGISWERQGGRATMSLSAQCEIERANKYDAYDSENYSAHLNLDVPATSSGRLRGTLIAGYFDGSRVDSYQNTRISESSFNVALRGAYQLTPKLNGRAGATYANTDPEDLAEYTNKSYNVGIGYNLRPDVSAFLDVRFTDSSAGFSTEVGGGTDTSGEAIIFGLDGQITPKLTGHAGFGYDWSTSTLANVDFDYTGPTYDVSLTWRPRERTTMELLASNGIESTSTGGTDFTTVAFTVDQEIGLNIAAHAGVSYRSSDFALDTRGEDDVWDYTIGGRYVLTRNISLGLSYTYTDSDSTRALTKYTRSLWRFTATSRF